MRYTNIIDITELPLYSSAPVRLLYLHLVLTAPWQDDAWHTKGIINVSVRSLADAVGISYQSCRTALAQLCKCGLIATQGVTQSTTQGVTQHLTQITIKTFNELQGGSNASSNAICNAVPNAKPNEGYKEQKQENNPTHTSRERVDFSENARLLCSELAVSMSELTACYNLFKVRCQADGKTHVDTADMWQHFASWMRKDPKSRVRDASAYAQAERDRKALSEKRDADERARKAEADRLSQYASIPVPEGLTLETWVRWLQLRKLEVGPEEVRRKVDYYADKMGLAVSDLLDMLP